MAWIVRLALTVLCWSFSDSASFSDLDANTLHTLDQYVRQDLVFQILTKLNDTIKEQNQLSLVCQTQFNQTINSCYACASSHRCTSSVNIDVTSGKVLPFIYRPVLAISHVIDDIKGTLGGILSLLGHLGGSFLTDLGYLSGNVGHSLLQVPLAKFNILGNGFLSLATGFGHAASDLLQSAGSVLNIVGTGAGSALNQLGQGAGSALDQLGQGAGSALDQLGLGAGSALNIFGHGAGSALDQLGLGAGSALDQLGKGAGSALNQLGQGTGGVVGGLASGVGSVGSGLLSGLGHLTSGATDLLSHVFGRKVATFVTVCGTECPVCDQLDTSKHTDQDITVAVCGANMVESQVASLANIARLEELYNVTMTSSILNKVQFDPTTIHTSGGVSFTSAYTTISVPNKTLLAAIPSGLHLSDLKSTAHHIVQEMWTRAELPGQLR